ncbi:MAG: PQQ-binding-like beta-propeller repeat protein [Steroidobacteraceae bacterium]
MRQKALISMSLGLWAAGAYAASLPASQSLPASPPTSVTAAVPAALARRARQSSGTEVGFAFFETHCTRCHGNPAAAATRAPEPAAIRQMSPERIYGALTTGVMKTEAQGLTDDQKRRLAEFMSGRPLGSAAEGDVHRMTGRCHRNPPLRAPAAHPEWNGWGAGLDNARFQTGRAAGLDAGSVPRLRLKWAFGFPRGVSAFAQPTIASGRVFVGSDIGFFYSLDARTGCAYWSFEALGSIRTAASLARRGGRYVVFFGDNKANVYALDAQNGALLWRRKVEEHFAARITGAPTVSRGVVYVPVSASEGFSAATPSYPCCTFRGSVVALDAATGRRRWKTYVIPQAPRPTRRNEQETQLWAPAGASIWDAPTIDRLRHVLYVGTGDAETSPASPRSDSVLALDTVDGRVRWFHQSRRGDAWIGGCNVAHPSAACPRPLGPDRDIGNSPILRTLAGGRRVLVFATKDARVVALDPDRGGAVIWRVQALPNPRDTVLGVLFGGAADARSVYYPMASGRMVALDLATGAIRWSVPLAAESGSLGGDRGSGPPALGYTAAPTVIPGVIFVGGVDGRLTALATRDGRELWAFDTVRSYRTVNGVAAHGGSMGSAGPTVAGGMLFVGSGYAVTRGMPGNVLLAFAPE